MTADSEPRHAAAVEERIAAGVVGRRGDDGADRTTPEVERAQLHAVVAGPLDEDAVVVFGSVRLSDPPGSEQLLLVAAVGEGADDDEAALGAATLVGDGDYGAAIVGAAGVDRQEAGGSRRRSPGSQTSRPCRRRRHDRRPGPRGR